MSDSIILSSSSPAQFNALLPLALHLKKSTKIQVILFLDDTIFNRDKDREICKKNELIYYYPIFSINITPINIILTGKNWGIKINYFLNEFYLKTLFHLKQYNSIIKKAYEIQLNINYSLKLILHLSAKLVINIDDFNGNATYLVRAAKLAKIKSIAIPFTISNYQELTYAYSKLNKRESTFLNRLFYTLFKKWSITSNSNTAIAYETPQNILAQTITFTAPANPWIPIGGNSDYTLFESRFMLDYYKESGFWQLKKAPILGSISLDNLFQTIQKKEEYKNLLYSKYKIDPTKKLILCALPPDYWNNKEYNSHEEIINDWIDTLSQPPNIHLLICPHPRTDIEKINVLLPTNCSIADEKIETLIPLCDLFVAHLSATIRFALAVSKPVLNFDFCHVFYEEYNSIKSVKTVYTKQDFKTTYFNLIQNNFLVEKESYPDSYFGSLDGKRGEAITDFICKLMKYE